MPVARRRVVWAMLGFALVTLVVLGLVAGRGEPWSLTRVGLSYDDYGIDRYTLTDETGRFAFDDVEPAALLSVTVWNADNTGQSFELGDWISEPVHELVVPRDAER